MANSRFTRQGWTRLGRAEAPASGFYAIGPKLSREFGPMELTGAGGGARSTAGGWLRGTLAAFPFLLATCLVAPAQGAETESDMGMVFGAIISAVATQTPGHIAFWSNPNSGHVGSVTVDAPAPRRAGHPCFHYSRRSFRNKSAVTFTAGLSCRNASGSWQVGTERDLGLVHLDGLARFPLQRCYKSSSCDLQRTLRYVTEASSTSTRRQYVRAQEEAKKAREYQPQPAYLYSNRSEYFTVYVRDLKKECGPRMSAQAYGDDRAPRGHTNQFLAGDMFHERNIKRVALEASQNAVRVCPQVRELHITGLEKEKEVVSITTRRIAGLWQITALDYPSGWKPRSGGIYTILD